MTRYVILGTGVAGVTAIETLRRIDRSAEITVVTEDPHGFYSRPGLAYYLSDEVPQHRLTLFSMKDWKALKVRYMQGHVTHIAPEDHKILISKLGSLTYDRLLLATGSSAIPLNVAGINSKGVVKLDTWEDARHILSMARRAKVAVIVGGGIISLEMAEGLAARGVKVHYFIRRDRYWSNVLDETESRIIEERLTEKGISIHYQTEIAEILQRRGRVTGVKTKQGETIPCRIVAVGIGVKPRTELAQAAGLKTDRGILANEYLETSVPDIYAAGDAVQALDPSTGSSHVDTLWMPARKQGCTAALNMAGKREAYARSAAVNVVRLAGVLITIIGAVGSGYDEDLLGVARGSSETWLQLPNTIPMVTGNKFNHLRVMVGENLLLGALVLGDQKLSLPLQELITQKVDITPIRNQLLLPESQLGHILMEFWASVFHKEELIGAS